MDLNETFIVPSFKRNLIFISALDKFGYYCSFENEKRNLFHNSNLIGLDFLLGYDSIYLLDIIVSFNESLLTIVIDKMRIQFRSGTRV